MCVIEGNGLRIRPLRDCPEDVAAMARWLSDPRVLEFYEGRDRPHDEQMIREVFLGGMAGTGEVACIVEYLGQPVGYLQFYPLDEEGLAEYGYGPGEVIYGMDQFIGEPEYWGRGIGTQMVRLTVEYLTRERGARRVVLDPVTTNGRAIRAYEKCGFRKVRLIPGKELHEGEWRDCWTMEYVPHRGTGVFGPAYRYMYENDVHAPGSVDRVLLGEMIRVCAETEADLYGGYTPLESLYRRGSRPGLERCVEPAPDAEEQIRAIAAFTAGTGRHAPDRLEAMRFGGTEEEIIRRGSDWCTDLARLGCALFQVAGLPARLAVLADAQNAYSGHVITEVYRDGVWGAVDTTTGTIWRDADGRPLSAAAVRRRGLSPQFREVALVNYFIWDAGKYDYTVSGISPYYRTILEMAEQGWPGGLRWLSGEDAGSR